ncbi:tetratricopeptide repeat protein [Mongoliitalea daihaiensis]|uniref:tetratricopeptide repeat protein n=1 Tax=Mongoliitalea daihaiensis TaxID=2782006 RepID=UPI001F2D3A57|nr:tetratricopeptide repeat protein [Mongoliitalea daihaiensis]UJP64104.1 tetratricopeptide repeat protein [Mongoliitalea daihaiensis]
MKNSLNLRWLVLSLLVMLAACSGDTQSQKGDVLFKRGDYEAAIVAYSSFLETKPKNVKALYNRGRAHEELGNFQEAEKDFLDALNLDKRNTQVMLSLSNLYQKQKNHTNALLYADYAVETAGAPAMAYFMKGRALHQLGNTEEALKDYSTAIKMDKDFAEAYFYRGMLKLATDKKKAGCEDLTLASKLNFPEAATAIDKFCK